MVSIKCRYPRSYFQKIILRYNIICGSILQNIAAYYTLHNINKAEL